MCNITTAPRNPHMLHLTACPVPSPRAMQCIHAHHSHPQRQKHAVRHVRQDDSAGTLKRTVPMPYTVRRGMQCTMYVKMAPGVSVDDLRAHLAATYEGEPFVKVRVGTDDTWQSDGTWLLDTCAWAAV